MLRRTLSVLLPIVVMASVLAAATPASAQDLVLRDARGDMWRSGAVGDPAPAPGSRDGDVTRAVVHHRRDAVVVLLRYVDLRRTGRYANYTVRVVTGAKLYREVTVEAAPGDWSGRTRVFRRNGTVVKGCAAGHRIDYARNTVRVAVPVSCLQSPRLVRVNVNSARADDGNRFYSDNPHGDRAWSRAWTSWIGV